MKDKLNVLHWMVTFVTLLGFVVFYFLIDDQRKRTMMALENSDSLLNMDVNSAVEKHVDYDKRLVQMSNTQKNHKDTIDVHYADFIQNRDATKEELERINYKIDGLERRFNKKIEDILKKIDDVEYNLSDDIASVRAALRNTDNKLKSLKDLVDKHELTLNPPKEDKGKKKKK